MKQGVANVNYNIKAVKVRLIGEDGQNYGEVHIKEALRIAFDAGLDLVEVGHDVSPPVCRVMDYGKWKYEQDKRKKKNTHTRQQIKEIKFRPNTGTNDLTYRAKQADKFIENGDKVKLVVRFKGREHEHMLQTGQALLEKFLELLTSNYNLDGNAKLEGSVIILTISPRNIK